MIEKTYKDINDKKNKKFFKNEREYTKYKKDKLKEIKNIENIDRVFLSRYEKRPKAKDFIENILDEFIYLHGDRYYGDDKSLIGGIGKISDKIVTFIGIDKGADLKESVEKNFGMAHPEGYRKAIRLMKQAEKFKRPVVIFIDTPGAYPGVEAEKRGQFEAIAESIKTMTSLNIPVISIITGEGCSGGAIGLAVCDYLIMLENSTYSILSPEGFASILWKNSKDIKNAVNIMKMTSYDLFSYKICDEIIPEKLGNEITDFEESFNLLKNSIYSKITEFEKISNEYLLNKRKRKFEI